MAFQKQLPKMKDAECCGSATLASQIDHSAFRAQQKEPLTFGNYLSREENTDLKVLGLVLLLLLILFIYTYFSQNYFSILISIGYACDKIFF